MSGSVYLLLLCTKPHVLDKHWVHISSNWHRLFKCAVMTLACVCVMTLACGLAAETHGLPEL
jgi:hypothetical protein